MIARLFCFPIFSFSFCVTKDFSHIFYHTLFYVASPFLVIIIAMQTGFLKSVSRKMSDPSDLDIILHKGYLRYSVLIFVVVL